MESAWWQIAVAVFGGFGGLEAVKWFFNRRANSRIALADADAKEFGTIKDTVVFLQQQLLDKETRFAEQTDRLREWQNRYFQEKELRHKAELELVLKKCEDQDCPFRRPPNANTPPRRGLTKEQYHNSKPQP